MIPFLVLELLMNADAGPEADASAAALTVVARGSGLPVVGVIVKVSAQEGSWQEQRTTDDDGQALFQPKEPGAYRVELVCKREIVCSGIETREKSVQLARGDKVRLVFEPETFRPIY